LGVYNVFKNGGSFGSYQLGDVTIPVFNIGIFKLVTAILILLSTFSVLHLVSLSGKGFSGFLEFGILFGY